MIPVNIEQDEDDPKLDRILEHTAATEENTEEDSNEES